MKVAFYEGNKTVNVREIEPVPLETDQVRLKVVYSGICGTDYHIYLGGWDWRIKLPLIMGHEMSGEISEIGSGVKGFFSSARLSFSASILL